MKKLHKILGSIILGSPLVIGVNACVYGPEPQCYSDKDCGAYENGKCLDHYNCQYDMNRKWVSQESCGDDVVCAAKAIDGKCVAVTNLRTGTKAKFCSSECIGKVNSDPEEYAINYWESSKLSHCRVDAASDADSDQ